MKRASIVSHCQLKDDVGALAAKMTERWLLSLRETNPAILAMFRERDTLPYRDLLPWSGEFAGKVLTGEVLVYRLTGQQKLLDEIIAFTEELISCIDANGYCGCFSKACRLTGACSQAPNVMKTSWDAWSHYHIMYALVRVRTNRRGALLECGRENCGTVFKDFLYRPPEADRHWLGRNEPFARSCILYPFPNNAETGISGLCKKCLERP